MKLLDQDVKLHTQYYVTTVHHPEEGTIVVRDIYEGSERLFSSYRTEEGRIIKDEDLIDRIDGFLEYKGLRIKF